MAIHRHALLQSLLRDTRDTSADCTLCHEDCTTPKHPELLTSRQSNSCSKKRCLTPQGEKRSTMSSPSCCGGRHVAITTGCGLSVERRTPTWGRAVDELGIHPTSLGWETCAFHASQKCTVVSSDCALHRLLSLRNKGATAPYVEKLEFSGASSDRPSNRPLRFETPTMDTTWKDDPARAARRTKPCRRNRGATESRYGR